ncbi:3-hydroxyacyl-thioester dehydratase [Amycolatopsis sp. K13G38]|uniref:3-hydroxyacyl-thioester dehydratase n=1 Tax=Amycolatopsis acididurans TaxID=2724524 RepID=A0ABX1J3T4_9PSEU|nr:MaoC/PaaZ C-terminal domain-containing protein [Amycolatopsis acididurans]NKQ54289.1 3-hydroxyacyl-thioester dehydratase [Amycolatopsis acididurans]
MPLDPDAVGATSGPRRSAWNRKDCILYALGVGAGPDELAFTTENTKGVEQQVLPTMPVVLSTDPGIFKRFGTFDWAKLVHAEQGVEVVRPLPPEGAVLTTTRIADMFDKGKAALVVTESESVDENSAELLFRTRTALFIGGAGGWGGDRGPSTSWSAPDRRPDHTVSYETRPDQALLYRLSGDRNPLHSDPAFARRAGFERPILHGLCTYGFTGRALLHALAGGDSAGMRTMDARFASPVLPGDVLHVDIWRTGEDQAYFQTRKDDGTVVLTNGVCTLNG